MFIPVLDDEAVRDALSFADAIRALERALRHGLDPEQDSPRLFSPLASGEYLIMPAEGPEFSGVKVLTIAPQNPGRGREKIQGSYLLFDSDSLAPSAVMDGASLTALRTPAVAAMAVKHLVAASANEMPASPRVLVIGAGIQGKGCIAALHSVFPTAQFETVGRSLARREDLISKSAELGITVRDRTGELERAVRSADIIVCATTSSTPLFDPGWVAPHAVIAAIGTHGLEARELDARLVETADLVVEARGSAARENGNITELYAADPVRASTLPNLQDLIRGRVQRRPGNPAVYTGVGMSWEDLVCATEIMRVHQEAGPVPS